MIYKNFLVFLLLRVLGLFIGLSALAYGSLLPNTYLLIAGSIFSIFSLYTLYTFLVKRFVAMDDFFESVKYRDFSRWFVEDKGPKDIRALNKGFNLVNKTIKSIDSERQAQFIYLQKILEMVDIGILAYHIETGQVLWTNESLLKTLNFPAFKNIDFVKNRKPLIYEELFETYHSNTSSVTLEMLRESIKVLISDTVFEMEEQSFKLIVLQNIEDTLNKNESEAWKKLLSVMTHEIMNSIAPISSLAETLQRNIQEAIESESTKNLEFQDIHDGLSSIKNRSEGLMKFAKTYRSLNRVTQVNKAKVKATDLFKSIEELMHTTLDQQKVQLEFIIDEPELSLEIDSYLIEQVLINLLLNALDAVKNQEHPKIEIAAFKDYHVGTLIKITDNGTGISPEIMDNIFVPFFTSKKTGSGIGLSLCKQIMLLHSGKIRIQSDLDKGTVVSLTF